MSSGQLILFGEDGKPVIYKPVNNTLQVGSDASISNVCLSGLKKIAFTISIDNFGRVIINNRMKRVEINGKRIAKNVTRKLVNNSTIQIENYKFTWKYESKYSKSYSLSPSKKSTQDDMETVIRNRKTISSFAVNNDENLTAANATVEPVNVQTIDETSDKSSMNAAQKRARIIPVKSNRTSELRSASIARRKSVGDELKPLQFVTPKKPIVNTAMAKSVNAIIQSESSKHAKFGDRKSLGSNLPTIIDNMNLFNVVTDEMKAAGPGAYILKKFGVTNSPKRTPKKVALKPKRLSLRSELSEMGILKAKVTDIGTPTEDQVAETAPINTTEAETEIVNIDTAEVRKELSSTLTTSSSVEIVEDSSEYSDDSSDSVFSIIVVDDSDVDDINDSFHHTENENPPQILADAIVDNGNVVSDKSIATEGSADVTVDDVNVVSDKSIVTEEIQQVEEQQEQALSKESPENVAEAAESLLSTPTKRQGNIRSRRNSRLCSLDECCSPSTFVTPSKKKLVNDHVSTPRSILKTPKASKTPKKTVRIMEIFNEEEDDVAMANGEPIEAIISNETSDQLQSETGILKENEVTNPQSDSNKNNASESELVIKSIDTSVNDDLFVPAELEITLPQSLDEQQMSDEVVGETATVADDENVTDDVFTPETPPISNVVSSDDSECKITESESTEEITTSDDVIAATATVADDENVTDSVFTPVISNMISDAESENSLPQPSDEMKMVVDVVDKIKTEGVDLVREIKEEKDDGNSSLPNECDESNMLDATFEIESNVENKRDDTPVQSTSHIDENNDLSDVRGVKELLNTPKPLDKTNLVGIKELLHTPNRGNNLDDVRGVKELLNTPKPLDKTNLIGMKELLNTPTDGNDLSYAWGVKELLNTPKPHDKTNLVGMKELLRTLNVCNQSIDMSGFKELLKTPKPLDKTNFVGVKELLETPIRQEENSPESIADDAPSAASDVQNQTANSSADAGKRYHIDLSFKFNTRDSLVRLVNNTLTNYGLTAIPEVVQPPPEAAQQEQNGQSSTDAIVPRPIDEPILEKNAVDAVEDASETQAESTTSESEPELKADRQSSDKEQKTDADNGSSNSPITDATHIEQPMEEPKVQKAPRVTRKAAEVTQSSAVSSTRTRRANKVTTTESNDENISETSQSSETPSVGTKVGRKRTRKATITEKSQASGPSQSDPVTDEVKIPKTGKRRLSGITSTESNDENISETSQASETPNVETKAGKNRKRKSTVTETTQALLPTQLEQLKSEAKVSLNRIASAPSESNDENTSETSQASETPRAAKYRTRKATVKSHASDQTQSEPQNDEVNVKKTRKRRVSGVTPAESKDENVSENSQTSQPTRNVTGARNDPVVQDAPAKVTRSTRAAKNIESSSTTENLTKPPAKRRRKMTEVEPTETAEPSPVKQTKKVKFSEESTARLGTRSSKRGKANTEPAAMEETPVTNKRPKRGKK